MRPRKKYSLVTPTFAENFSTTLTKMIEKLNIRFYLKLSKTRALKVITNIWVVELHMTTYQDCI